MPAAGQPLTIHDVEEIIGAMEQRSTNFPDESFELTCAVILLNIGNRYTGVSCVEGEWVGIKKDIPKGEGVPTCPNGHPLMEGAGLQLGWLARQ